MARFVRHVGDLLETLEANGAGLVVLSMGGQQVATSTATGKMMLSGKRRGSPKLKPIVSIRGRNPLLWQKLKLQCLL